MRKKHSPHGNVGPNNKEDIHRRCNVCDFLAGVDGRRQMHRDPYDPTGGYICEKCKRPIGQTSHEDQERHSNNLHKWHYDDFSFDLESVDGQRTYDEMVEDLISDWEKSQDR